MRAFRRGDLAVLAVESMVWNDTDGGRLYWYSGPQELVCTVLSVDASYGHTVMGNVTVDTQNGAFETSVICLKPLDFA